MAQEDLPEAVQGDILPHTVKKLYPQLRFQGGDGAAEGGLGDPELLRGPGKMLELCHLFKVDQGVDIHAVFSPFREGLPSFVEQSPKAAPG